MKCQKCSKLATFHITDIERGKPASTISVTSTPGST